jgi:hypothetical protein
MGSPATELSSRLTVGCAVVHEDQIIDRKAKVSRFVDEPSPDPGCKIGTAGQYPQIATRGAGNGCPPVVFLVEREHVITPCEGPEEGDRKAGGVGVTLEDGATVCFFPSAVFTVDRSR